MRKILVAIVVAVAAIVSQAASFNWGAIASGSTGKLYLGTTAFGSGTAYLFDAASVSRETLLKSVLDEKKDIATLAKIDTSSITTSKVVAKDLDYGTKLNSYDFYWAAVKDGNIYISTLIEDQECPETGTTEMTWTDVYSTSYNKEIAEFKTGQASYAAGWYTAGAIPEPTSGLMLLLGVGLMALRRRRA